MGLMLPCIAHSLRLFVLMTGVVTCTSLENVYSVLEGNSAELVFNYSQIPSGVTFKMRLGERFPFYVNRQIVSAGLTENQQYRFEVNEYVFDNGSVSVTLIIHTVTREDKGIYTCDVCDTNSRKLANFTRSLELQVDYPMGPLTCVPVAQNVDISMTSGIWHLIECSASVGSSGGFLTCYQHDEQVPPWTELTLKQDTLVQTLWMKGTHTLFCCASAYENPPQNECDCNDFIWDPVTGSEGDSSLLHFACSTTEDYSTTHVSESKVSTRMSFSLDQLTPERCTMCTDDERDVVYIIMIILIVLFALIAVSSLYLSFWLYFIRPRKRIKHKYQLLKCHSSIGNGQDWKADTLQKTTII